jgi:hypothetical protein
MTVDTDTVVREVVRKVKLLGFTGKSNEERDYRNIKDIPIKIPLCFIATSNSYEN